MRKVLLSLAAALVLAAAPAAAQQGSSLAAEPRVAPASTVQEQPAQKPAAPSFYVSRERIDEAVRQMEAERSGEAQAGSRGFWYTVAAVALGVIIALLILD